MKNGAIKVKGRRQNIYCSKHHWAWTRMTKENSQKRNLETNFATGMAANRKI